MADRRYREILFAGLWRQNPALVQLLGLCPLLAIADSVVKALAIGFATLPVLLLASCSAALLRRALPAPLRLLLLTLPIGAMSACVELLMQAFAFELHLALGIFLPLIASNCLILARAEQFASRNPLSLAALDALAMGAGLLLAMVAMGAIRELLGTGTLFSDMQLLFGEGAAGWRLRLFDADQPFLLPLLPPGAFILLGLLVALKNLLDDRGRR